MDFWTIDFMLGGVDCKTDSVIPDNLLKSVVVDLRSRGAEITRVYYYTCGGEVVVDIDLEDLDMIMNEPPSLVGAEDEDEGEVEFVVEDIDLD